MRSRLLEAVFGTGIPRMFAPLGLIVATGLLLYWLTALLGRVLIGRWHGR